MSDELFLKMAVSLH